MITYLSLYLACGDTLCLVFSPENLATLEGAKSFDLISLEGYFGHNIRIKFKDISGWAVNTPETRDAQRELDKIIDEEQRQFSLF